MPFRKVADFMLKWQRLPQLAHTIKQRWLMIVCVVAIISDIVDLTVFHGLTEQFSQNTIVLTRW